MLFSPYLLRTQDQADLTLASDLSQKPTMWAIPDLLPCHRLSLVAAPSGTGLSTFAYRLLAQVAPAPQFLDASRGAAWQAASPESLPAPEPPSCSNAPELDTSGFAPEDLVPNPFDPDWDPTLPLVPEAQRKPQPADQALPTALLISFRDDPDVLRPRLLAAGVDPNRVLILSELHAPDPEDPNKKDPQRYVRPFSLADAPFLQELLHEYSTIRLVLIDNADLLTNTSKRPTRHLLQQQLLRLHYVAQLRSVSITLLAPIPRLSANPFQTSFLLALQEACREVYLLAPALPGDPADQRYLFSLKHTLSTPAPNLQLGSASSLFHPPSSLLPCSAPTELSYSSYLQLRRRRPGPLPLARLQAMQFLTELLASGPLPVGDQNNPPPNSIRAQLRAAGLSWGTVRRAATEMSLRIFRDADHWYWSLPATSPAPALPSATCASFRGQLPVEAAAPQGQENPPATPILAPSSCAPSSTDITPAPNPFTQPTSGGTAQCSAA